MATIKIFDTNGVKELQCFDTVTDVPYIDDIEDEIDVESYQDDRVDF